MSNYYERGSMLADQYRYQQAIEEFRLALAAEPEHAWAYGLLAWCLEHEHAYAGALVAANTAIEIQPDESRFYYFHARILVSMQKYGEAQESIDQALKLDCNDVDYYWCLAKIQHDQGKYQQALAAVEQGLALDPEHQSCLEVRLFCLYGLQHLPIQDIQAEAKNVLTFYPESYSTHTIYAWSCLEQLQIDAAEEHYRIALRLRPNANWARIGLIKTLKAHFLPSRLLIRLDRWVTQVSKHCYQWISSLPSFLLLLKILFSVVLKLTVEVIRFFLYRVEPPLSTTLLSLNQNARIILTPSEIRNSYVLTIGILASLFGICLSVIHQNIVWLLIPFINLLAYFLWQCGWPRAHQGTVSPGIILVKRLQTTGVFVSVLGIFLAIFYRQNLWYLLPCASVLVFCLCQLRRSTEDQGTKIWMFVFASSALGMVFWLILGALPPGSFWADFLVNLIKICLAPLILTLACMGYVCIDEIVKRMRSS
jgi:tetratricopeptide (TPR) repeat protein